MADELLKLKWNGHISSFLHIFQSLRNQSKYTDVTLACEGRLYTVHRLVLASCSQFFDHIFEQTPSENTVIVLNEAKASDIEALLDYMYCGQVDVQQSKLGSFIRTAKCLQIKGLAGPETVENITKDDVESQPSTNKRRKSDCSVQSLNASKAAVTPTVGVLKESSSEIPKQETTSASNNLISNYWVFQKSDLPNTTWSTSPHSKYEDKKNSECLDTRMSSRNLIIDESSIREHSPHILNNFKYSANLISASEAANYSYNSSVNSVSFNYTDYEQPLDFKKEIKEEADTNGSDVDKNLERNSEFSGNSANGSEYVNSPEVIDDYEGHYIDGGTLPSYDNSPQDKTMSLKVSKRIGASIQTSSSVWKNNPGAITTVRNNSNQATVSPKLMPYAKCSNCQTNNTKLWRRSMTGEIVCNACGLYFKLHGVNRPSHLFRNAPMTRRRNPRKKKRSYEEILEAREQPHSIEEQNDAFYNESGCDSDTQDGLAVLNAALTLNSLFAKAQEAAAKHSEYNKSSLHLSSSAATTGNHFEPPCSSPAQMRCDSSSATSDTRPPPPPLLKLSLNSNSKLVTMEAKKVAMATANTPKFSHHSPTPPAFSKRANHDDGDEINVTNMSP